MSSLSIKAKLARVTVATVAAGAALASVLPTPSAVHADPKQYSALQGVGSDTIEALGNALSGFSGTQAYTPITSGAPSYSLYSSWDALGTACITTKTGGPSFTRPNGSGQGARALSRAIDAGGFGNAACGGVKDVSGQIDFARSSSGPSGTGTALTYVPFARDGVSFAYYRASGGPAVTSLTKTQLTALFTVGPQLIDGVNIIGCGIQTGSGTYTFWNSSVGATASTEATATTDCNNLLGAGVRAQENDGAALKARGDAAPAGTQVVIGFSAAAFIAKSNLVTADPAPPAGVGIGSISDFGGSPVAGTAPNLTPNSAFYTLAGGFGRYVYNVVSTARIDALVGNTEIKGLFKGPNSAVCTADATVSKFGFLPLDSATYPSLLNCGDSSLKAPLSSGQI
jgi:ABC-type phosphate transport system substrate-binding protein